MKRILQVPRVLIPISLSAALLSGVVMAKAEVKTPQEQETTYGLAEVVDPSRPKPCDSFKEFQSAYEAFLKDKELSLTEEKSARLALQISQGCTGAAERFRKSYEMMKKTGVALTKAVEIGLQFALLDDDRLKNFNEVFSKMYLENVYNFDFRTAYKVSFALSKDYEGKAKDVRDDFVKLVKFCTSNDKVALPVRQCAEFALTLIEHSAKFPGGLYSEFEKFYTFIRTDKRLGLSILESFKLIPKVLAYGPKATVNFEKGLDYALSSSKITIDQKNAVQLALRLAEQTVPPASLASTSPLLGPSKTAAAKEADEESRSVGTKK